MKCSNCGAEIGSAKYCTYCGTQVSYEMRREQEQLNIQGCPQCGSSNIQFRRENQGEIRGKSSKQIIHRTVGFCKDCGATWYPNSAANEVPKKRKTWLWVLGWLFIFPVPLTILMLRKKEMNPILKYGIIAVAWIVYLLIGISGNSSNNETTETNLPSETIVSTVGEEPTTEDKTEETAQKENSLSFVLMDDEIGEYGVEVILNEGTEFEEHEIAYYIPSGTYTVTNLDEKGGGQVTVYSGGPEYDGEWQYFVADDNCASPIVVMAGESKELEIKDGQFVVLSDETSNIQFSIK